MQCVQTPEERFSRVDLPYSSHYLEVQGMQMHYLDEGAGEVVLALHGEPSWCYLYRKFIPVLSGRCRFIAPDFIGFGKSDKLLSWKDYSFTFHYDTLTAFIERLTLSNITLVVQDWGGLIGLSVLGAHPQWFKRVVIMNTFLPRGKKLPLPFRLWQLFARYHPSLPIGLVMKFGTHQPLPDHVLKAYKAPFPSRKYKAGARAFPQLIPNKPDDPAVPYLMQAREALSQWERPAMVLFSDKDPVMSGLDKFFVNLLPQVHTHVVLENAGHFLQEDRGEEIARQIQTFIEST